MKKRKLISNKKRKPSQIVLINIIIGTTFSILMGVLIWLMGREIGGDSYLIVLLTLGIGMGAVLIPFVIVYILLRKKEKSQERGTKLDSGSITEKKVISIDTAISTISEILSAPSTKTEPIERACEYCGYESVTEGKICPKCDKYILIKSEIKEEL
jgi:hypothetical protein